MTTWPFSDPPNVAIFTGKKITKGGAWVQNVTHDADDGAWQFHPEEGTDESEAVVVGLKTIAQLDPSILELADLPLGWYAWRESKNADWNREEV